MSTVSTGDGGLRHRRADWLRSRLAWKALVGSLILGACSGEPATTPAPIRPANAATSSTSPGATAIESPTPTVEVAVRQAYERYLVATVAAMGASDPTHPDLAAVARDQARAAARARVAGLRAQNRVARGEFVPTIQQLEVEGDTARIRDCYRVDMREFARDTNEQVADRGATRFAASAVLHLSEQGQWVVVEFVESDFCVPAELAEKIEAQYLAFWEAVAAAGQPPNPNHPALAATAAGGQLEGLRGRLAKFREKGYEVRDDSVSHPLAVQVSGKDTVAIVRDCRELDPKGGVYNRSSGDLVDEGAKPGQRALWEVRLERLDGSWKVVDADLIDKDSGCDPAAF